METELKKAAEILQKDKYGIFISKDADVKGQLVIDTARAAFLSGMTEGAKWQEQRMYTKSEMLMAIGYANGAASKGTLSHAELKQSCIDFIESLNKK
jgi:hypothetical protein